MKKLFVRLFVGVFVFLLWFNNVMAYPDHPSATFGTNVRGPIWTYSPVTLPAGRFAISFKTEFLNLQPFSDLELKHFAEQDLHVDSEDDLLSPSLSFSYGLLNELTVSAQLPYVLRSNIREGELEHEHEGEHESELTLGVPSVVRHGDSDGIGDINVSAHWRFLNNKQYDIDAALIVGTSIPTGDTQVRDDQGNRFETEHLPGTGSLNPFFGGAVSKKLNSHTAVFASVLYTIATRGAQGTNIGNVLNYNVALSYRLIQNSADHNNEAHNHEKKAHASGDGYPIITADAMLEFNGENRQKVNIEGIDDENSGGGVGYISPGFRLNINTFSLFASIGLPVYQSFNGIQTKIKWRGLVGFSEIF